MTNWLSPNPFSNPKKPTFAQKRAELLQGLEEEGFQVSTRDSRTFKPLKIPHATSRDGRVRFWFKPQAIYYTVGQHRFNDARSWTEDMRTVTAKELANKAWLESTRSC